MPFPAAAQGGPLVGRLAPGSLRGLGRRQQPAASGAGAAATHAAGQAGQSPAAAAAASTSAATLAARQAAAQPNPQEAQGGKPGGPTNLPPAAPATAGAAGSSNEKPTEAASTSFSAPSWSTDPGAFISSTAENSGSKGLSQPVIGALVGGIIGGIALIIVSFVIWRQCRGRGEKIAPP